MSLAVEPGAVLKDGEVAADAPQDDFRASSEFRVLPESWTQHGRQQTHPDLSRVRWYAVLVARGERDLDLGAVDALRIVYVRHDAQRAVSYYRRTREGPDGGTLPGGPDAHRRPSAPGRCPGAVRRPPRPALRRRARCWR
jgi:hypothetical protein